MMNNPINNALLDILPTFHEQSQLPRPLVNYSNDLYNLSLSRLNQMPKNSEIARHHVCALLACERLKDKFDLPELYINKIPIPTKQIHNLIDDFRTHLFRESPSPTKISTIPILSPDGSPKRGRGRPRKDSTMSPEKRKRSISPTPPERSKRSPFKNTVVELSSPKKTDNAPKLSSPLKKPPFDSTQMVAPRTSVHQREPITSSTIVSICNRFEISQDITYCIIRSFNEFKPRIKNDWALLCGIVAVAYFKINRELIETKIGVKTDFLNRLYGLQNGRLVKSQLLNWIKIVGELINCEKWVRDLEILDEIYDSRFISQDNMLVKEVMYFHPDVNDAYDRWVKKMSGLLSEVGEGGEGGVGDGGEGGEGDGGEGDGGEGEVDVNEVDVNVNEVDVSEMQLREGEVEQEVQVSQEIETVIK